MNRFDYVNPAIEAVVDGLEDFERIIALEQGQYIPLRTLPGENGNSRIYRVSLTDEQREMVATGADVEILTFGGPMAPSRVMLLNQREMNDEERLNLAAWFRAQAQIPDSLRQPE